MPPFSNKKYMTDPVFHHCYMNAHFLISLFENAHIFAQIFSSETKIVIFIVKLCLQTAKRVYKIKEQYMNM